MNRNQALLWALGALATAAGLLSLRTFVLLWRDIRGRRRARREGRV